LDWEPLPAASPVMSSTYGGNPYPIPAEKPAATAVPPAFDTDLREYVRVVTQEDIGKHCINVSDGRRLLVEIDRLRLPTPARKDTTMSCWNKDELEQMLYDVVNVLNLSDAAIAEHGPRGTAPAKLVKIVLDQKDRTIRNLRAGMVDCSPNPGQPLLDELDRLRRLEAAVEDDSLMRLFYKDSGHADVTKLILCSYRDALLAAMKGARAEAAAESATEDSDEQVAVVMHEQSMVIERLTRERDEAQASPGQPLLDELDRLNKLVTDLTAKRDNLLAAKSLEHAAILAALHDGALALRVGAEATDKGQDCDTAIRWYRQAVLDAGKKD